MLMEFDKADWPVDNAEWMQERKLKWSLLQEKLLLSEVFKIKHAPVFRNFYLNGVLDLDGFYSAQGSSLMLMLLHPKQSLDNFRRIYDAIDSIPDMARSIKHYLDFSRINHSAAQRELYGEKVYDAFGVQGIFDGQDRIYAQVFWGDSCDITPKVDVITGRTYPYIDDVKGFFSSYLWPAAFFMLGITQYRYAREQYQAEYWYCSVKHNNKSFIQTKDAMTVFFQSIYYFDKLAADDGVCGRKQLAEELKLILDTREFPPRVKELWEKTKQIETQSFDLLNSYRSDYGLPMLIL